MSTLTLYSLPTLSFLVSKDKEDENEKKFPMKFLAYWGILAVKVENKNIKKSVQKRAFAFKDWHEMLPLFFKGTLQQGQPPLLPSIHIMEVVLPVEVKVSSIGVILKSKLKLKCMTALYNYIKRG